MRKEFKVLLISNGIIILLLLTQVYDLITLLYDDRAQDMLTPTEMEPIHYTEQINANGDVTLQPDRPLIVPKIIHQTYKNETIPAIWEGTHKSVLEQNKDWEYILWTDESARNFIKEHYGWFLKTWDGYPYPIMRADAIRYFVLYHYGGIYMDLDSGCRKSLEPLLTVPAFLRPTEPTGISNDIMSGTVHHPFYKYVIDNLQKYNHNWFISYITIMYSTGPLFLSVLHKRFKRWGWPDGEASRIRLTPFPTPDDAGFFYETRGSSWHLGDAKLIFAMGKYWPLLVVLGFVLAYLLFSLEYQLIVFLMRRRNTFRRIWSQFYQKVTGKKDKLAYEMVSRGEDRFEV